MKYIRYILFPFSILYYCVTSIRNFAYDYGIFKSYSFKTPIIVVGNLSVGGTGKTPQIEYLIRLLQDKYKVAVLSRGYKRSTKGYIEVNQHHKVSDVGDEPLQYFKKFDNISVAVNENRVEGINNLNKDLKPEVILLDDAYQHRRVKASFQILLTKYNDLFTDDFLLPSGNLRESRIGAKRANCIVVTKCPSHISEAKKTEIKAKLSSYNKPIYFSCISYSDKVLGETTYNLSTLKNYTLLLITGIANPKPLLEFLSQNSINFHHLNYPDHYNFKDADIKKIKEEYKAIKSSNKLILTTEKDYVRLSTKLTLNYLPIKTLFLEDKKLFNSTVLIHISKNNS